MPNIHRRRRYVIPLLGQGGGAALAEGLWLHAGNDTLVIRDFTTPANDFSGAPSSKWTTTRSGTVATVHDSSGTIQGTSADTLRRDFDPRLGGGIPGYLSEAARTNLCTHPVDFTNAAWSKSAAGTGTGSAPSATANNAVAPDGTTTASLISFPARSATTRFQFIFDQFTGTVAAYAGSFYVKAATAGDVGIGFEVHFFNGSSSVGYAEFTLTASWQRISIGATLAATTCNITISNIAGSPLAAWGMHVWCAQVELGAFVSSPIPTGSGARSAETITLATSAFPWSATVGTLMFEGHTPLGSGTQALWQCDDGTENERFRLIRNSSNEIRFVVTDGGSGVCDLNLGTVANNTAFKAALSWAANDFVGSLNGATAVTDTTGTLPTVTTMRLGSSFTGEQSFAHCKRLTYLPLDKTAAQIEALAA